MRLAFRCERYLLGRPFLARLGIAAHMFGGEGVESLIVHGVDRDKLALQVGRGSVISTPCFLAVPVSSSQWPTLAAAFLRSMNRLSQAEICTPL